MVNEDWKSLPNVMYAIAVLTLVSGVAVILLGEFQTEQQTRHTVVNDTITFTANDTYYYLYNNATSNSSDYWVELVNDSVQVWNRSTLPAGNMTRAGNWTVDVTLGRISQVTGGYIGEGSSMNVTYSYITGSAARDIYGEGITGVLEVTNWIDLMALIFAVGIILYIVVRVMGGQTPGQQGGRY